MASLATIPPTTTNNLTDQKFDEFLDTVNPEAKSWKYIEFRCMIQDILGNEIYSRHNSDKFGDRTIFYCITIPGENDWVRQSAPSQDGLDKFEIGNSTSSSDQERLSISLVNYSFPIPNGKNKSCLIKVYDVNLVDCLRVNDIVQVGGLVEPIEFEDDAELQTNKSSPQNGGDIPAVATKTTDSSNLNKNNSNNQNSNGDSNSNTPHVLVFDDDFEPAKDFPERLVPRIHVRTMKKLPHINPLLPQLIDRSNLDVTRIKMAHARLSTILEQLLGGDSLTAEYMIYSLIARVHRSKDIITLGQMTTCLCGFKPEMKFLVDKLYEIASKITTHSHYIDLSIASLNNLRFSPEKDHENNKMIAGTLQLPDGLFLMLNETALSEGLLTSQGTSNLATLNNIIRWQKHKYNFQYHSVEIDTDLKILVISEGKSILPVHVTTKLEKNDKETIESMRQACESVDDFLTEELMNMFRYYITSLMDVNYSIPEDLQKLIAHDYATWRSNDEASGRTLFNANDLNIQMTLARYRTISRGETVLTRDIWEDVCKMERARVNRLAA